jgi:hypothetical protein
VEGSRNTAAVAAGLRTDFPAVFGELFPSLMPLVGGGGAAAGAAVKEISFSTLHHDGADWMVLDTGSSTCPTPNPIKGTHYRQDRLLRDGYQLPPVSTFKLANFRQSALVCFIGPVTFAHVVAADPAA